MKTFTSLFLLLLLSFAATAQYCMLQGRTSYSTEQPGITKFKLNSIERVSLPVEGPLSVPSLSITGDTAYLKRGQTYTVTIEHTKDPVNFPTTRNNIRVWLDYNKNSSFTDANETVVSKDFEPAGTFTATFTVPANATLGMTRLRATAKMSSDAGHTPPTPCDEPKDPLDYHGEMEDYIIIIQDPTGVDEAASNKLQTGIYPNPVTNDFTVTLENKGRQDIQIELYDATGKKTASLYSGKPSADNTYHFNLNNYTTVSGIYFIKAVSDKYSSFEKIIKAD